VGAVPSVGGHPRHVPASVAGGRHRRCHLTRPTLFVCAANDFAFPERAVQEAEELVRQRPDCSESSFRFRRYAGTYHGFAIRGDERNPVIERAKGKALDEAVDFFRTHV
jgi:dienelactone hydrolase